MENLLSFRWTSWYVNMFIVLASLIMPMVDFIKTLDWIPFTYFIVDTRYVLVGLIILSLCLMFSMFVDQISAPFSRISLGDWGYYIVWDLSVL